MAAMDVYAEADARRRVAHEPGTPQIDRGVETEHSRTLDTLIDIPVVTGQTSASKSISWVMQYRPRGTHKWHDSCMVITDAEQGQLILDSFKPGVVGKEDYALEFQLIERTVYEQVIGSNA